jgi:hypothetical protein
VTEKGRIQTQDCVSSFHLLGKKKDNSEKYKSQEHTEYRERCHLNFWGEQHCVAGRLGLGGVEEQVKGVFNNEE